MTQQADVIVIGAGIIGCSVAYELARRGAHVHVVDGRDIALGATQASAGVLAPYIEGHRKGTLQDLAVASLALYDGFVDGIREEARGALHYNRTGSLQTAPDGPAAETFRARARELEQQGVRAEFLDAAAVREAEPHLAPDVAGGLLVRAHGFINAVELTLALWEAAAARGVHILRPCQVRALSAAGPDVQVDTDDGSMTAATVVLAAGSWSGRIAMAGPPVPVHPVRGQLLYLDWVGTPLARVVWGPSCYLVPWSDGSLLVGATAEEADFDERATVAGVRDLLDAVSDLVPHAWQAGFAGVRVGLRPATPDELPIIGRSDVVPGVVYATGHYRNGILLAPLTATLVADLVLGGREAPELQPLRPARFSRA